MSSVTPSSRKSFSSSGMTLLEVLIAVLLFAVFSGTFLMVTELIAGFLPAEKAPLTDRSCNGPSFEESCVNIALDLMIPYLEKASPEKLDISGQYMTPDRVPISEIQELQLAWPDAYQLEIIQWPQLSQVASTTTKASLPGLYLIQAQPVSPAFWRKPIQRLFCRPYHRCIR